MTIQLAIISARARRLYQLLSEAGEVTTSSQTGKIMEETSEVAQCDLAGDTAGIIHELADVIIAASQCALAATPDGLDLLWDELADTLDADCHRNWRAYGGVIRHSPPWTSAEIESAAETAGVSIRPDPSQPGTACVVIVATLPCSLAPRLHGMGLDAVHNFAQDLLDHASLAPTAGKHLAVSGVTVDDGILTVHGTLTSTEGAPRPEETSW